MEVVRNLPALQARVAALRARHGAIGLAPTMGALHEGHLALIAAAKPHGAVVASIFVNPLQFSPGEDLARYPRTTAADLAALAAAGCDLAWLPDVAVMYGAGDATVVEVGGPAQGWEGAHRPGHFRGVATVVARLLCQVGPDRAFFGEKDWQQCQVVRRMAADLALPVRIVTVPTVRAPDGLALSSRNRFLSTAERARAPLLHKCLHDAAQHLAGGAPAGPVLAAASSSLTASGFGVDYLALVDAETLARCDAAIAPSRLIAAARLGAVRLLDNVPVIR